MLKQQPIELLTTCIRYQYKHSSKKGKGVIFYVAKW